MTCHTKEDLENMLFDVVNELDLSDEMISPARSAWYAARDPRTGSARTQRHADSRA